MECEFCNKEISGVIVFVPSLPHIRDGSITSSACKECAIAKKIFCEKHQTSHQGFKDETTACKKCINELTRRSFGCYWRFLERFCELFSAEEFARIKEWIQAVSHNEEVHSYCVVRAMASVSLRTGMTMKDIYKKMVKDKNALLIIPSDWMLV